MAWRLAGYLTMTQLCVYFFVEFFYVVGLVEFQNRLKNKIKTTKNAITSFLRFVFNKTNNSVKKKIELSKGNGNNRIKNKNTFDYVL